MLIATVPAYQAEQKANMRSTVLAAMVATGIGAAMLGPVHGQTLRIALRDDVDTMDPALSETFMGTIVYTAMCDKLFDIDEKLNIVPMLATSYETIDPQTIVIHLRDGVLFQDGEKMDAAAVKYTLDRDLNLQGSYRRSEVNMVDHVEVVDPLTVKVSLKQPSAPFIAQLTDRSGMIVSPKAAEAEGTNFTQHPVCAGPFKFVDRVAQDHITLERFPQYWDAKNIHFDKLIYQIIPDSTVRLTNLQAGGPDFVEQVAPTDVAAVQGNAKLKIVSSESLGFQGLSFNTGAGKNGELPLARDKRVRQAFELAIDRDALVQVVFNGMFKPTAQAISPVSPFYVASIVPPARDIAKAKALLAAAGVTGPIDVTLSIINDPLNRQVAEVLQSMTAEAGFNVKIVAMEIGSAIAALTTGEYQVFQLGWSGLLDPDSNIWLWLHTGGPLNDGGFSNPKVDALLEAARATTDVAKRRDLYGQMWQIIQVEEPFVFLWTTRNVAGMKASVTGYRSLPDGLVRLQGVSMAP
jgi:peptide/nickel transport system substrate-binding protein